MKSLLLLQSTPTVTFGVQNTSPVFKDFIPLIQSCVWPSFWILVCLIFRTQIVSLFNLVLEQIKKGASVEVAGLKLTPGKLVERTADLGDEVKILGNPDRFKLLFKAQGIYEGSLFKKSTKAMQVPGGCVVQVTNERRNPDGSWSVAESLTCISGEIKIEDDVNSGHFLDSVNNPLGAEQI
jgi:hypothetical protein